MADTLLFDTLFLLVLVWIGVMGAGLWPPSPAVLIPAHPQPDKPTTRHSPQPKPFAGLTHKPLCAACEHGGQESVKVPPGAPPPQIVLTRGRPRQVETQQLEPLAFLVRLQERGDPTHDLVGQDHRGDLRLLEQIQRTRRALLARTDDQKAHAGKLVVPHRGRHE